jgi:5'-3' exonuclease
MHELNTVNISINKKKPVVIIDGSYYVFYRYFATYRWFSFQKKEFDINSITESDEYIESFLKHMDSDFKKILKKWNTDINNIIICSDCYRSEIWRNDIYKNYKGTRVQNINFNTKIFPIFNEYITKKNIKKITFDRLEGDDIIYLIQKKIKEVESNKEITIITNDNDYLQIPDVNIINMQFKDIRYRGTNNVKSELIFKAIYGDKSDNIPKIAPFITKEKALTISSMSETDFTAWLEENNLTEKYEFNLNLISFDKIPSIYVDSFYKKYNITIV